MSASIKTNNYCWKVGQFDFMHPLAKYPIFKFSDFAIHHHHIDKMHCRTLPSWNGPYQRCFARISWCWWSLMVILTFQRVRDWKSFKYLIFSRIMWSFMNPVKKKVKGDRSGLLGDYLIFSCLSIQALFKFCPNSCLYRRYIFHLGLGHHFISFKERTSSLLKSLDNSIHFSCSWINTQSTNLHLTRPHNTFISFLWPFSRCFSFDRSFKTMSSSQKSSLVPFLAWKNGSIYLMIWSLFWKISPNSKIEYITHGCTKAKPFKFQLWLLVFIKAHIDTFHPSEGFFSRLKTPDFTKRRKCYHVKKHPVQDVSASLNRILFT